MTFWNLRKSAGNLLLGTFDLQLQFENLIRNLIDRENGQILACTFFFSLVPFSCDSFAKGSSQFLGKSRGKRLFNLDCSKPN